MRCEKFSGEARSPCSWHVSRSACLARSCAFNAVAGRLMCSGDVDVACRLDARRLCCCGWLRARRSVRLDSLLLLVSSQIHLSWTPHGPRGVRRDRRMWCDRQMFPVLKGIRYCVLSSCPVCYTHCKSLSPRNSDLKQHLGGEEEEEGRFGAPCRMYCANLGKLIITYINNYIKTKNWKVKIPVCMKSEQKQN